MKLFGELEGAIMRTLWEGGEMTVRDVHERLSASHGVAYTTVMTVMARLAAKRMLSRRMEDGVYVYRTRETVDHFFAGLCGKLVETIRKDYGATAAQAFVSEFGRKLKAFAAMALVSLALFGGVQAWAAASPAHEAVCRALALACADPAPRSIALDAMTPAERLSVLPLSRP